MNTISQPGGSAYGRCEKHQVPLIHTITESVLCAVCEKARADEAERLRQKIVHCDECGGSWYSDGLQSGCPCQAIDLRVARARGDALEAERNRLAAVVERLPKTRDGVPVTPGMFVYGAWDGEGCVKSIHAPCFMLEVAQPGGIFWRATREVYSTREAAEKARKGTKP